MNLSAMTVEDLLKLDILDPITYGHYRQQAAEIMNRLDPKKPAGTELCDAVMRFWTSDAFEAIAIRQAPNGHNLEVYLRQRGTVAEGETAYISQWHAPGSIYRHGERDCDVAGRLEKEFGCSIAAFHEFGHETTDEQRGTIRSLLMLVTLAGEPRIDARHQWFSVTSMPAVTVDFHEENYIPRAAIEFASQRRLPFRLITRLQTRGL